MTLPASSDESGAIDGPPAPADHVSGTDTVAAVGTLLVAASLFALLAHRVTTGATEQTDQEVRDWVRGHRTAALDAASEPVKVLSMIGVVVPASALAAFWMWRQRGARPAVTLLAAPALAAALGFACSTFLEQRNPPDAADAPGGEVTEPSFPSGHTAGVTAEALSIAYVLSREGLASPAAVAALLGWPLIVGTSRLYRDRHWVSDIAGGWLSGTAVAAACAVLYAALE